MSLPRFVLPFALSATAVLSACGSAPVEPLPAKKPNVAQINIGIEAVSFETDRRNSDIRSELKKVRKSSLDGKGRIFKNDSSVTIYTVPAAASFEHVAKGASLARKAEKAVEIFLNDRDYKTSSSSQSPVFFREGLRIRLAEDFDNERHVHVGKNGEKAVYNIASGRVCVETPELKSRDGNNFPDCVDKTGISKSTSLGRDIAFVDRKLGL